MEEQRGAGTQGTVRGLISEDSDNGSASERSSCRVPGAYSPADDLLGLCTDEMLLLRGQNTQGELLACPALAVHHISTLVHIDCALWKGCRLQEDRTGSHLELALKVRVRQQITYQNVLSNLVEPFTTVCNSNDKGDGRVAMPSLSPPLHLPSHCPWGAARSLCSSKNTPVTFLLSQKTTSKLAWWKEDRKEQHRGDSWAAEAAESLVSEGLWMQESNEKQLQEVVSK